VELLAGLLDGFVASLFIYAASSKAADFQEFAQSLPEKPFVGHVRRPIAAGVIAAEGLVGVALLFAPASEIPRLLALILTLALTLAAAAVWLARWDVKCHCFGASDRRIGATDVIRDLALAVVLVVDLVWMPPAPDVVVRLTGVGVFLGLLLVLGMATLLKPVTEVADK
jgi:hypothetical protein